MTLTDWTSLAIVILAVQAFFMSIVLGVALYFGIRGTTAAIRQVRIYGPLAQGYARQVAEISEQTSQRIASPFINASARTARVRRTVAAATSSRKSQEEV